MAEPRRVRVRRPDGKIGTIPEENLQRAVSMGWSAVEEPAAPPAASPSPAALTASPQREQLGAIPRFLNAVGETFDPKPVMDALTTGNPVKSLARLAGGVGEAQAGQLAKAREAWGQGRYADGVRYALGYVLPVMGPAANAAGDELAAGKTAEGLGHTVGLGLQVGMARGAAGKNLNVRPILRSQLNPEEAAAIQFADSNGIPVDLAMRTGNRAVGAVKTYVQNTLPGSTVSKAAQAAQADALTATGERLANRVYPKPVTPMAAGMGVQGGMEAQVLKHNTEAGRLYDVVRSAEANPANTRTVPIAQGMSAEALADLDAFSQSLAGKPFKKLSPTEQSAILRTAQSAGVEVQPTPVMQDVGLPVDMRTVKAELAGPTAFLQRQMPIAQQRASTGMKALENIQEAPDFLPASLADADLSAIKAAARGADLPELRTLSQGLAARAVNVFEDAVQKGVEAAGPEVSAARNQGRWHVARKAEVAGLLRQLREEPAQVYGQLTQARDSGAQFLAQVSKEIPAEMPKLGRAYVQGMLEEAMASGEFSGSKSLLNRWQSLGPQTKKILFQSPAQVSEIGNFFRLAEMQARNPNPSGTAHVLSMTGHATGTAALLLTNPVTGAVSAVAPYLVAKALYSPKAAKVLMTGMKMPVGNAAAAAVTHQALTNTFARLAADAEKEREREQEGGK